MICTPSDPRRHDRPDAGEVMTSPYLELPIRDELDVARRTLEKVRKDDQHDQICDNTYANSGRMAEASQRMAHWRRRIRELEAAQ